MRQRLDALLPIRYTFLALGSLDKQNTVFRAYWPVAHAHSFRAATV
jgi:hypothetical protein